VPEVDKVHEFLRAAADLTEQNQLPWERFAPGFYTFKMKDADVPLYFSFDGAKMNLLVNTVPLAFLTSQDRSYEFGLQRLSRVVIAFFKRGGNAAVDRERPRLKQFLALSHEVLTTKGQEYSEAGS
jgi:hypothetical protein